MKPLNAYCTSEWGKGRVTKLHSRNNVISYRIPWQILDVGKVISSSPSGKRDSEGKGKENNGVLLQ